MDFSRPEYWSGSLSLLQEIFPTQGSSQRSGSKGTCKQRVNRLSPGFLFTRETLFPPGLLQNLLAVFSLQDKAVSFRD